MVKLAHLLLAAALLASPVSAQDGGAGEEAARQVYQDANADYALGHYREALEKYELAFKYKQVPALLFNIAQCHRQLRQFDEASTTFRSFIRLDPSNKQVPLAKKLLAQVNAAVKSGEVAHDAQPVGVMPGPGQRPQVLPPPAPRPESLPAPILSLEKAQPAKPAVAPPAATLAVSKPAAEPARAAAETPPVKAVQARLVEGPRAATAAPPPPAPSAAGKRRVLTWVAGGAAVGALAAGGVFGLQSKSTQSQLTGSLHTRAEVDQLSSQYSSQAGKANVLLLAGGVLAAVAVTLFVLEY